jgi:uncharacterized iron-regulated membrane protein
LRITNFFRRTHYWASVVILLPILIMIGSGFLLLLKKDIAWIQPETVRLEGVSPPASFDSILARARSIPELEVSDWSDIDRLDVRPNRGIVKVRSNNRWEAQLNLATSELEHLAYRRSDLIESIHDGSWFHENAKLMIVLPSAAILLFMTISGTYLFTQRIQAKRKKKRRQKRTHS